MNRKFIVNLVFIVTWEFLLNLGIIGCKILEFFKIESGSTAVATRSLQDTRHH